MYFLQMTRSMEHTEEEDNDEGGGREEVTNEQLVKGTSLVYNVYFYAIHAQFMQCNVWGPGMMSENMEMA